LTDYAQILQEKNKMSRKWNTWPKWQSTKIQDGGGRHFGLRQSFFRYNAMDRRIFKIKFNVLIEMTP